MTKLLSPSLKESPETHIHYFYDLILSLNTHSSQSLRRAGKYTSTQASKLPASLSFLALFATTDGTAAMLLLTLLSTPSPLSQEGPNIFKLLDLEQKFDPEMECTLHPSLAEKHCLGTNWD